MSGYEVEPAEVFAAGAMASEAANEGRAELARLRAAADDLLGHGWRGGAATAFGHGWREWHDGARSMLSALDEMARALDVTAREYEQNETSTAADFRRIA